jgi:hypothetical protein
MYYRPCFELHIVLKCISVLYCVYMHYCERLSNHYIRYAGFYCLLPSYVHGSCV